MTGSDNQLMLCDIHLRSTDSGQSQPIRAYQISSVTLPIRAAVWIHSNRPTWVWLIDPDFYLFCRFAPQMTWGNVLPHTWGYERQTALLDQYCAVAWAFYVVSWKAIEVRFYSRISGWWRILSISIFHRLAPVLFSWTWAAFVFGISSGSDWGGMFQDTSLQLSRDKYVPMYLGIYSGVRGTTYFSNVMVMCIKPHVRTLVHTNLGTTDPNNS